MPGRPAGRSSQACGIDPLQRAVTLDPTRVVAHYQLGDAYNQTDRLTDALEAYDGSRPGTAP